MLSDLQRDGEELVAAARAGDQDTVRRIANGFISSRHIDEGIPYWERATQDAHVAFTLARYRKIRDDRPAAEMLYRSAADTDADCAYGLAVLLQEVGDPEALDWFRRGWELGHLSCKIELGKRLAAEGSLTEASKFLMAGAELGDIAVFRWVELFEDLRATLDQIGTDLASAGTPEEATEAIRDLNRLRPRIKDFPGLLVEAEAHYRSAEDLGSISALVDHAITLDESGPEHRSPEISGLLLRARELGYLGAAYLLGVFAEQRGDLAGSEQWYTEAAVAGHESAQWNLAIMCQRQRRLDEAEHWFREVGEDDAEVAARLAALDRMRSEDHTARRQEVESLPSLRDRAEAGDAEAGFHYGRLLHNWGGATARYMFRWIRPAAEAGSPAAANVLANLHDELSEPILRDRWRRRAAELGHHHACLEMGMLSAHYKDWQEAERWYEISAESGDGLSAMLAGKLKAQRAAFAEAEPLLRHAWEVGEEREYSVETAGYYGLVLHRLGRSAEAAPFLRTAVARWHEVEERYDPDDLDLLARMPNLAEVLVSCT